MIILASSIIAAAVSATVTVIVWFLTERYKRNQEQYVRKLESYKGLIKSIPGFYVGFATEDKGASKSMIANFIDELNQCWLYCPDDVIHKGHKFLSTVRTGNKTPDMDKEKALGEFIVAIREDLLSRKLVKKTELTSKHFQIHSPN